MSEVIEIRSATVLPAIRKDIEFQTEDGLRLVGELALPVGSKPVATLITFHPLPTHGGFMDSHVLRKAANRLPALAGIAVLRFNTRGTGGSSQGTSEGVFDHGNAEKLDLEAAIRFAQGQQLENLWLVGWSFGTELALKYGSDKPVLGAILLSPPLHRTSDAELAKWQDSGKRLVAIVPEHDDYLTPEAAVQRFAVVPQAEIVAVEGAKHLWVGESATKRVLDEIVRVVNPSCYPLPEVWNTA